MDIVDLFYTVKLYSCDVPHFVFNHLWLKYRLQSEQLWAMQFCCTQAEAYNYVHIPPSTALNNTYKYVELAKIFSEMSSVLFQVLLGFSSPVSILAKKTELLVVCNTMNAIAIVQQKHLSTHIAAVCRKDHYGLTNTKLGNTVKEIAANWSGFVMSVGNVQISH